MEKLNFIKVEIPLVQELLKKVENIERRLNELNQKPSLEKTWLDVQEVCKILHVGPRTLINYANDGKLMPTPHPGGKKLYRTSDVQEFLEGYYPSGRRGE